MSSEDRTPVTLSIVMFDRTLTFSFVLICMPQFWIAIFFILLAIAQLYQSLQEIDLPLPVYLVLGTALAVASNVQRKFSFTQDRQDLLPKSPESDLTVNSVRATILTSTKNNE